MKCRCSAWKRCAAIRSGIRSCSCIVSLFNKPYLVFMKCRSTHEINRWNNWLTVEREDGLGWNLTIRRDHRTLGCMDGLRMWRKAHRLWEHECVCVSLYAVRVCVCMCSFVCVIPICVSLPDFSWCILRIGEILCRMIFWLSFSESTRSGLV